MILYCYVMCQWAGNLLRFFELERGGGVELTYTQTFSAHACQTTV